MDLATSIIKVLIRRESASLKGRFMDGLVHFEETRWIVL